MKDIQISNFFSSNFNAIVFGPSNLRNNKKFNKKFSHIERCVLDIFAMLEETLDPELFNNFVEYSAELTC